MPHPEAAIESINLVSRRGMLHESEIAIQICHVRHETLIYSIVYLVLIAALRARYGVQDLYHHGQRKSSIRFFTTQVCRAYIP